MKMMSQNVVQQKPERSSIATSRVIGRPDNSTGGEETVITAHVTIPHDISWGWVVVAGAFVNVFLLDGVAFTYGSMMPDITSDLEMPASLVALIHSIAVALYFLMSPLASAFINRYGFRECAMTGSVVVSFSLLSTYFAKKYWSVLIFYGFCTGMGYSLINMSSGLVVGFYFDKWRAFAMAVATCGSSCGVMIMFPANTFFVKLAGWRTTTLLHSGLFGIIFFTGMLFRPLTSFTITKTDENTTRVITYLPSVMSVSTAKPMQSHASHHTATTTQRLFKAVSNINYPTAAEVVKEEVPTPGSQAGPSHLTVTPSRTPGSMSQRQLKQLHSIISRTSTQTRTSTQVPIELVMYKSPSEREPPQSSRPSNSPKSNFCKRLCRILCHWEPHEPEVRPLYRDDAFYEGRIESLIPYQKSRVNSGTQGEIGLEYHLAVTRTAAVTDIEERRGVFTTAIRRVLATMMDPNLLRRNSFILFCCSGFLVYSGFLVPYVYLQDRNSKQGIETKHCSLFVSTISLSNAFGRLILGTLASRLDPLKLFSFSCSIAGISTISSGLSYSLFYQYTYCCVFGFGISSIASLRSVSLVGLYGLDKLTNSTGMMLIFVGFGNLVSTPLAGVLKNYFGYDVAFIVAGSFITAGGLLLIPVRTLALRENEHLEINSAANRN